MQKLTQEYVENDVKKNKFTLLSEYQGHGKSILIKGDKCNHEFEIIYSRYEANKKKHDGKFICPKCLHEKKSKSQKLSFSQIKHDVYHGTQKEYKVISFAKDYETSRNSKLIIYHKTCGHPFESTFSNFKLGRRCPICASKSVESNAAQLLKRLLKHVNIDFEVEKEFDECFNHFSGSKLRFDIFIPVLNMVVEIDGEQHFTPVERFGGSRALRDTQFRDFIKNKFCLDNKILLKRVPLFNFSTNKKRSFDDVKIDVFNLFYEITNKIK